MKWSVPHFHRSCEAFLFGLINHIVRCEDFVDICAAGVSVAKKARCCKDVSAAPPPLLACVISKQGLGIVCVYSCKMAVKGPLSAGVSITRLRPSVFFLHFYPS